MFLKMFQEASARAVKLFGPICHSVYCCINDRRFAWCSHHIFVMFLYWFLFIDTKIIFITTEQVVRFIVRCHLWWSERLNSFLWRRMKHIFNGRFSGVILATGNVDTNWCETFQLFSNTLFPLSTSCNVWWHPISLFVQPLFLTQNTAVLPIHNDVFVSDDTL